MPGRGTPETGRLCLSPDIAHTKSSQLFETERIVALISIVWAILLLLVQWYIAWGGGRIEFSAPSGRAISGIIYNFTIAMLPSHKESISKHPMKFVIGLLMHIGVFISIVKVLILLISPGTAPIIPNFISILLGISVICGFYLFVRRIITVDLRSMSVPDDYISILLTIGLMIMAIAHETGQILSGAFLIYASIIYFYMPLGKLKHVLFFFIARAEYGGRLGYRGVYPVHNSVKERSGG